MLAVLGAGLIAGVDVTVSLEALAGDGLALLGAICAGGYVLAGARARERLATSAYAVAATPPAPSSSRSPRWSAGAPLVGFSARDWLLIAGITFFAQLFGHTLLNLVLSSVGPTVVSLAVLLEVPGSLSSRWCCWTGAAAAGAARHGRWSSSASRWWCAPAGRHLVEAAT